MRLFDFWRTIFALFLIRPKQDSDLLFRSDHDFQNPRGELNPKSALRMKRRSNVLLSQETFIRFTAYLFLGLFVLVNLGNCIPYSSSSIGPQPHQQQQRTHQDARSVRVTEKTLIPFNSGFIGRQLLSQGMLGHSDLRSIQTQLLPNQNANFWNRRWTFYFESINNSNWKEGQTY